MILAIVLGFTKILDVGEGGIPNFVYVVQLVCYGYFGCFRIFTESKLLIEAQTVIEKKSKGKNYTD